MIASFYNPPAKQLIGGRKPCGSRRCHSDCHNYAIRCSIQGAVKPARTAIALHSEISASGASRIFLASCAPDEVVCGVCFRKTRI
jgi:hypothetical protein